VHPGKHLDKGDGVKFLEETLKIWEEGGLGRTDWGSLQRGGSRWKKKGGGQCGQGKKWRIKAEGHTPSHPGKKESKKKKELSK